MNNFEEYIFLFFENLELYENRFQRKNHKEEILDAVTKFLRSKTEYSAHKVYESFFDAYWVGIQNNDNPFLKLIQIMKSFEESAGKLIENQRDHYIHTVFVFLLGLAIYSKNNRFRKIFKEYALDKNDYPDSYSTNNEEFFYRWGISSLFHDVAYPLEITLNQVNRYINFIWSYPDAFYGDIKLGIELPDFENFIDLPVLKPSDKYNDKFLRKYSDYKSKFHSDTISILSESISSNFTLDFYEIKNNIMNFLENMKKNSFIDHGFYSAVIMLRWYYYLVKTTKWNPAYFYFPIADAASAIFLHNYYQHILMKNPFNLNPMRAKTHPIAYLLILCDELQEWNRKGYGEKDLKNNSDINFDILIDDEIIEINYISYKIMKIDNIIKISDVFKKGIVIK